jgi:hypothetical protein
MSQQLTDLAQDICDNRINGCTDSIPISAWLHANLGKLNAVLNTSFSTEGDTVEPNLDCEASAIYSDMYLVDHYSKAAAAALGGVVGSSGAVSISMIKDGESEIRFSSAKETGKEYMNIVRQIKQDMNDGVAKYLIMQSPPRQVGGEEGGPYEFVEDSYESC